MDYFQVISLPFKDELVKETLEITSAFNTAHTYCRIIEVSNELLEKMNTFFESRGLSRIVELLIFKRKFTRMRPEHCHIDRALDGGITKCSVVVPIIGGKNAGQYWYNGDYTFVDERKGAVQYKQIYWKSVPELGCIGEFINDPVVCRTDIPHDAFNNNVQGYRVTCTIRFINNEPFEYVHRALS